METVADVIIKFLDLLEAQFADFRGKLFKVLIAIGLLIVALVLAMTGFIMFVVGVYQGFCVFMPNFLAAFAVALLSFLMGGGLILWAKKKMS
ncbi:MAG: phage holin family protein [Desulfitobacterium sp.]|nr:phage holin family protein [Desulfitobacterium sp.]